MSQNFEIVQEDDVLSFEKLQEEETEKLIEDIQSTLEISDLFRSHVFIDSLIDQINFLDDAKSIIKEGVQCQMMTPRQKGWISGKIKLSLQFIADEDINTAISTSSEKQSDVVEKNDCKSVVSFESPLDEIRNLSVL
jgi:hypothetical protein